MMNENFNSVHYQVWGGEAIDASALQQMNAACQLPVAVRGALMADAHLGYGLPIGGVLACRGAVIPYAVGVDIACRMRMSILDIPVDRIERQSERFDRALTKGTVFGVGGKYRRRQEHAVLDADWNVAPVTRHMKDRAAEQLGTSGSGNHFAEFGVVTLPKDEPELGLKAGEYVGLLSHSGSRGSGAAVCSAYSQIAREQLPAEYGHMRHLGWLSLSSEAGQEYWAAMNLMGDYAAANHAVIHRNVLDLLGEDAVATIENHHNFAWLEEHDGEQLVVHRKGATPAAAGELGVIPGTMADPAYIVRGRGNAASLNSASHGAGRQMSRNAAKQKFRFGTVRKELESRGVRVLAAGADEVPGAYKDIRSVMEQQSDLVETLGTFQPRIVLMCGDNSKAED